MNTDNIKKQADELQAIGMRLTWGVTVPIALFILGIFIMPIGLVLWLIAAIMFLSINSKTIIKYADSKGTRNEKN